MSLFDFLSPVYELFKAINNVDRGQIGVKKKILVTFEVKTFSDIAEIALKRNISRRFLAGEEGFEPSAYGFGDRRSTS